jgi:hypothetical protein
MADSDVRQAEEDGIDSQYRNGGCGRLSNGQETDPSVDNA